ncbi:MULTISPECIES: hypothetical protein [unclassified Paenibacillus]|uniref:hypothetical protein n=1 Tax=unclassified Paenibacillus TaxID=185978 RepID=UPI001AE19CEE|nr:MULTISPECIES: hypothetical protein [unclassified Paenibacillus]MBP1155616.1 hypothetical protein [Paenibacillus sp. PvP091]MBP1168998.1 hypothetical protein [Paenibacillus sp. PvR098]MBP2440026.1 hypothetical protein [Paenibacillus sp. PvP052]
MESIYPITAEQISPYVGRHVCAVFHDGSYCIGKIGRVEGGNLYLDEYTHGLASVSTSKANKAKDQISHQMKAKTSAFTPFFSPFAVSLAALAFLFAIPFFFI